MACSSKGVIDVDSDTSGRSEFLPSEVSESEEPARAAAVISETPAPAAISRSRVLSKNTSLKPVAVRGEKKLKNKSILERVGEFRGQYLESFHATVYHPSVSGLRFSFLSFFLFSVSSSNLCTYCIST